MPRSDVPWICAVQTQATTLARGKVLLLVYPASDEWAEARWIIHLDTLVEGKYGGYHVRVVDLSAPNATAKLRVFGQYNPPGQPTYRPCASLDNVKAAARAIGPTYFSSQAERDNFNWEAASRDFFNGILVGAETNWDDVFKQGLLNY
ncbi:hypothetical protein JCM8097_001867 [Rhodosporidiobolus ruineniae]